MEIRPSNFNRDIFFKGLQGEVNPLFEAEAPQDIDLPLRADLPVQRVLNLIQDWALRAFQGVQDQVARIDLFEQSPINTPQERDLAFPAASTPRVENQPAQSSQHVQVSDENSDFVFSEEGRENLSTPRNQLSQLTPSTPFVIGGYQRDPHAIPMPPPL